MICALTTLPWGAKLSAQTGLLIVAHGADSGWNAQVQAVVDQVHWHGPVRLAFVMGPAAAAASFEAQVAALRSAGATRIVAVPLMVSTYGSHVTDIQRMAAGHADTMSMMPPAAAPPPGPPVPIRVTAALDSAPEVGQALRRSWDRLSAADRRRPLVLVAHGPNDDAEAVRWIVNLAAATRGLATALPDRAVHVGLLRDDALPPVRARAVAGIRDTITALATRSGDSVMVMTVLISSGSINDMVVPRDLAGMPMHYAGTSLAPDPALARWIERVASRVRW